MHVLGTAGHVDHGKSTLVQALTGMNPDRLREEQERQMTIDLGFAWMTLPGGEAVGIVDVPGHRDFIENMLAGVGGIDAVLLVVAADEGVMPQTREHLAILDLLGVREGVVALAKIDLVEREWLELVAEDVRAVLSATSLAEAPLVPVSAKTGEGLQELILELERILGRAGKRQSYGRPRLPVDRSFTISGFGTVVTGTLMDGEFRVGDEVEILPARRKARIRGLQTHRKDVRIAVPGSRVAVNLSGVRTADIRRGDVLAAPESYQATNMLDSRLRLLSDAEQGLEHNREVKIFLGAAQRTGRVRLLGVDRLRPGEQGWIQIVLNEPLVAHRGDRFILRRPSPPATIGGGIVADPHPLRRHRRRDVDIIRRLEALLADRPEETLLAILGQKGLIPRKDAAREAGIPAETAEWTIGSLIDAGRIVEIGTSDVYLADVATWNRVREAVIGIIKDFHGRFPLRGGIPLEELRSRTRLPGRVAEAAITTLEAEGVILRQGKNAALKEHTRALSKDEENRVRRLLGDFRSQAYSPPSRKESEAMVGEEVLAYLIDTGELIAVSEDVLFARDVYEEMVAAIIERIGEEGSLTVAQVRDQFATTRKYALALMEHLDQIGITVREGDARRLGPKAGR